ncbi:hypothetical protein HYI35_19070 [Clostridium sporogenes]|nr:hypothetical protein [Clostridium sporogenes]MBY7071851.1 hypothetical protein [Clostridium sporogenes]
MEANSIDEIKNKAEEELNELVNDYKKKRKDIFRKKNLQIKKFKEEQAKKLGYALLDFFETTDVNKVIEELKLQDKITIK